MKESINKFLDFLYDNLGMVFYIAVWGIMVWFFWARTSGSDAFGYALLTFYLIFPLCSLAVNLYYGLGKRRFRLYLPFISAALEIMLPFTTFDLSHRIAYGKWSLPDWADLQLGLYALIPGLVGLGIGSLIQYLRAKRKSTAHDKDKQ